MRRLVLATILLALAIGVSGQSGAIIIDHHHTDLSRIPATWLNAVRANLRVGYGHTSHGSQLVTGLNAFRGAPGAPYYVTESDWGLHPGVVLNDYWGNAGGASDLGLGGDLGWRDATLVMLNLPANDRTVVMWSWCGGVSSSTETGINTYLQTMSQLEAQYPDVTFVYMTGHLDGTGSSGNLNLRNEQIRQYCRAHNKVLFDFADIESYDPDGQVNYMAALADDSCRWDSNHSGGLDALDHNWAADWVQAHPTSELAQQAAACGDCAHSQKLNCVLKGRAFWWMLARIAGWDGATVGEPLTVLAPDGGERWLQGATRTIKWTMREDRVGSVRIDLLRAGNLDSVVADGVDTEPGGTGQYEWSIPVGQAPGDDYQVRVTSVLDAGVTDTSDATFGIEEPPSITVESPNGGEVWQPGLSATVRWRYSGTPAGHVRVVLLSGSAVARVLASRAPVGSSGSGSFTWKVPLLQRPGENFRIRVSAGLPAGRDDSDAPFAIRKPTIAVMSPSGGEVWNRTATYAVSWEFTGDPGPSVRLELWKGGVRKRILAAGVPAGDAGQGSCAWTIPASTPAGTGYRVQVVSEAGRCSGRSTGPFAIQ